MSFAPNFELVTELMPLTRRDFYVADPTLLNPNATNPLVDGEWLKLDTNYALVRGADADVAPQYPLFAERGRYDTQAIGKSPVLFLGMYEADTTIMDATGVAIGDPLAVFDVTIGGLTKRGLKKATSGKLIVGWCTRLPTGKIRFVH